MTTRVAVEITLTDVERSELARLTRGQKVWQSLARRAWIMVRLLARISRNDLHWLNTLDAQELRALLQLIATAKARHLNIATLLEEHNRHCTG